MLNFRNKLAGDPGKFTITILFTIRALSRLTRKAVTPTNMIHQLCLRVNYWNISVGPGAEKENKTRKGKEQHPWKQTGSKPKTKVCYSDQHHCHLCHNWKKGLIVTARSYLQPAHITHTTCLLGSDQSYFRFYMSGGFLIHCFVLHLSCCLWPVGLLPHVLLAVETLV